MGVVAGRDRFVIAFSADQTIGSNGDKFIGLGDTSNTHGVAAIPLPWGGELSDLVGRSLEVCSGDGQIVYTVWLQKIGHDAEPTDLRCTIVAGDPLPPTYNGQACKISLAEGWPQKEKSPARRRALNRKV